MIKGIIGRKSGMTRVFTEDGLSIPVTVVELLDNSVIQIKAASKHGYSAIQVGYGNKNLKRVAKAQRKHYAKAEVEAPIGTVEFRVPTADITADKYNLGDKVVVDSFKQGQKIDVTGVSKGKGFQGGVKRWNFSMLDATHGNSISHRSNGSIGQCQTPGRVFKGKKMSGHMGSQRVTTQNLEVVRSDNDNNALLVKGAVPGANGGIVIVRPAVKYQAK